MPVDSLPPAAFDPHPGRRFAAALSASLLLHALVLAVQRAPAPPASLPRERLEAQLRPPAAADAPAEPLLKDTLARDAAKPSLPTAHPPPAEPTARASARPDPEAIARRKLAAHVYYPPEAVSRGLEGEVRLLLTLDAEGRIVEVQLAAGSGHALLDAAALEAARRLGRLPGLGVTEMILPVEFRLQ